MCAVRNAPSSLLQTPTVKEKPYCSSWFCVILEEQDSFISGAEMLAFESGACSVTVGHRAHVVCGAERTFEPVADTNSKRKTLLFSRVLMLVEATGLEPVTSRM